MKAKDERYTVAVDFDGVLHSYMSPWVDAETIPDPPVPGAIDWLNEIARKLKVIVFTTRGKEQSGREAVANWLWAHGCRAVLSEDVTAIKPPALLYIDDRAWRFEGTFPTAEQIHQARPWNKQK